MITIHRKRVGCTKTFSFDAILREKLRKKRRRAGKPVEHFFEIFHAKARKTGRFSPQSE